MTSTQNREMPLAPSDIGARAELAVATALSKLGKRVYVPLFSAHSRVDLVFEDDKGFARVQCKTSHITRGAISFNTCSNTRNVRKDYGGEIDYFGVFSPELDAVYLVPVEDVPQRASHLRIEPAKNNQIAGIRMAENYKL